MQKRTRFIILLICLVLFFTITPVLIFYSLGYKIDFNNFKITATGGIYIRAEQSGTEIIIDSKINKKTGFFSNSVFIQNLLPDKHNVLVKKDGYFYYIKNINVIEKQATKIENITLFKNNIEFINTNLNWPIKNTPNSPITLIDVKWNQNNSKAIINTNKGYFLLELNNSNSIIKQVDFLKDSKALEFNLQNPDELFFSKNNKIQKINILSALTIKNTNPEILIDKVISFQINNNHIIWLGQDGNLNQSDLSGKNNQILTANPILLNKNNSYKIFSNSFGIFLLENNNLLILNKEKEFFEIFAESIKELQTSPDNKNIFYITSTNEILLNHSNYEYDQSIPEKTQKILLNKFYENISQAYWLNNNYLIFKADNKIKISEIDNRNNININDLPINLNNNNYQIYFNQQDKKLYILNENNLIITEKILP